MALKRRSFSKMMRRIFLPFAIAVFATAVVAQPGPPDDAPRWGRDKVEAIIVGKFVSELNLSPEQAEKFFPRFRQFQNEAEDLQRQQRDRRMEMDRLSQDPNADPERVNSLISEQSLYEQRISGLKRMFLTDVSGFLSPQQVSRCSILMDDLPRRVRELIRDQQQEHRGSQRGGSGRGRPRGY